jgi:hypothetical protein
MEPEILYCHRVGYHSFRQAQRRIAFRIVTLISNCAINILTGPYSVSRLQDIIVIARTKSLANSILNILVANNFHGLNNRLAKSEIMYLVRYRRQNEIEINCD